MVNKKIPERMCIACKESKPKKDLLRIVKIEDGYTIDFTGKLSGRGAYICNSDECFNKLIKNKLLSKTFKENISNDTYTLIQEMYLGHK